MRRATLPVLALFVASCVGAPATSSPPPAGSPTTAPSPTAGATIGPTAPAATANTGQLDPSVLPTTGRIGFAATESSGASIYLVDPDGTDVETLPVKAAGRASACGPGTEPGWTPDGRSLLYTAPGKGGDGADPSVGDIIQVTLAGNVARKLMSNGRCGAVSPDGRWLSFNRGIIDTGDAYVVELNGTSAQRRLDEATGPIWSPDGAWLLMFSGSRMHAIVVGRDGSGLHQVDGAGDLRWTPDGRIASVWYSDTSASFEIVVASVDTPVGLGTRRFSSPDEITSPAMLPDGQIVYVLGGEVWRLGEGSQPVRLTDGLAITGALAVSSDGTWLAASTEKPQPGLVVISVDGGYAQIVRTPGVSGPVWQPRPSSP